MLLMLAHLCQNRAEALSLSRAVARLEQWLSAAFHATELDLDAIRGECSAALNHLNTESPPRPYIQVDWEDNPADPPAQKRVFLNAWLCWGRARDVLPVRKSRPIVREHSVAEVAECVDDQCVYRDLAYDRLELIVSSSDLNYQWEYPPDTDPSDDQCCFYAWPVVIRLRRKSWEQRGRVVPNNPIDATQVACLIGDRDRFLQEAKQRGAFFVCWPDGSAADLEILRKVTLWTGLGLWLRTVRNATSAETMLSELTGRSLESIPEWYHQRKTRSDGSSPWRHVSLLYDLPDVRPSGATNQHLDPGDLLRINQALQ